MEKLVQADKHSTELLHLQLLNWLGFFSFCNMLEFTYCGSGMNLHAPYGWPRHYTCHHPDFATWTTVRTRFYVLLNSALTYNFVCNNSAHIKNLRTSSNTSMMSSIPTFKSRLREGPRTLLGTTKSISGLEVRVYVHQRLLGQSTLIGLETEGMQTLELLTSWSPYHNDRITS